jgi:macrolide-specific efflux system membrane fusion protein
MKKIMDFVSKMKLYQKIIGVLILIGLGWFGYQQYINGTTSAVKYTTEKATKGNLIVSIAGSGTISTANNAPVNTKASGVVTNIYVKDGDIVKTGDKIADIELDLEGRQTYSQAWSSYQSAQNSLASSKASLLTTQATMFSDWDKQRILSTNSTYENSDGTPRNDNRNLPEYRIVDNTWLASEAKYKIAQSAVTQSETSLNTAWYSYQQASPTIIAPISGKVSGLSIQVGAIIASNASSSSSNQSNNKIASIKTDALPVVSVNLTEIDILKVKIGNKATITVDAMPNDTFTGKIVSIDTVGTKTSGVVNYPVVIQLDLASNSLFPNMNAAANIITDSKNGILVVPSSAIITENEQIMARVMKNGKMTTIPVEIGISSDTQTEIVSGITEGTEVVSSVTLSTAAKTTTTSSAFSIMGGNRNAGGGGNIPR